MAPGEFDKLAEILGDSLQHQVEEIDRRIDTLTSRWASGMQTVLNEVWEIKRTQRSDASERQQRQQRLDRYLAFLLGLNALSIVLAVGALLGWWQ